VRGVAALWSPSTGIVDSHALMLALQGDAERHGAVIAPDDPRSSVVRPATAASSIETRDANGARTTLTANSLITARDSTRRASRRRSKASTHRGFRACVARRGTYFAYAARRRSRTSSTRCPNTGASACTRPSISCGQLKFGPDVEWLTEGEPFDYVVRRRTPRFVRMRDPQVLARPARRPSRPRVHGHPSEAHAARRAERGLRVLGSSESRRRGTRPLLRHRVARTHVVARDRRAPSRRCSPRADKERAGNAGSLVVKCPRLRGLLEQRPQLAALVHLADDVGAPDELALHVELRNRRPVRNTLLMP